MQTFGVYKFIEFKVDCGGVEHPDPEKLARKIIRDYGETLRLLGEE